MCDRFYKKNLQYCYIGLIIIGVKGMTKKELGCKVLITIFDESIPNNRKSIISFTEVDMNENRGLFYCAPEILLETKDLHHIKIGVMSRRIW